ncbi:MAG: DUF3536 domain-containing protein [Candidatus Gastranaerophilales bacterium]|nr:DUF3536 domain-containing protein [Candidatus Gastranaerophilales bacterium]
MTEKNREVFLAIHGHFYQPPRENPWLEAIELQPSALPCHDWNERVNNECYAPNSTSKVVNNKNEVISIVNNYEHISFNFGPTLLSWMEEFAPTAYERIIKADIKSVEEHGGHGNAIAQVYNHIIMPLANELDKQTQVKWGIKDFEYRFGRKPEGMWLAETAVDDDTLRVLVENGIKFTILSPFQAKCVKKLNENNWQDVSWGNIDPAHSYRYYIKSAPDKYIDLFFYDGAISKSVAFDELLRDGNKFLKRLQDGISYDRNYPQIVNIATDGESYGHHTKFGDMALSFVMAMKVKESGLTVTNYAEYLENYRSDWQVQIKDVSSWSCSHGVGRWCDDCGCSTGGYPGWNQKWRRPLRDAMDYLRDSVTPLFTKFGQKYFKNPLDARFNYIDVILDRSYTNVKKFQKEYFLPDLSEQDKVNAMKLLEIQRQAMLMYTSCGWFFCEISGIETVQIMKYAARVIQLAKDFTDEDYETNYLEILSNAQSNYKEIGNGRDIYERFVRPSVITEKQIVSLWAVSSLYEEVGDEEEVYCYVISKKSYKKIQKGDTHLVIGNVEIQSKVTLEKHNLMFALLQYSGGDFHCAIKEYSSGFTDIQKELIRIYMVNPLTEIIRALDSYFGKEYFTLKDIFIEERRKILQILMRERLDEFAKTYEDIYSEGKGSVLHLQALGLDIPNEFKIAAQYTLTKQFNELFTSSNGFIDDTVIQTAGDINFEAKKIGIKLDKAPTSKIFSKKVAQNINRLVYSMEYQQAEVTHDLLDVIEKLDIEVDKSEAQNLFFSKVVSKFDDMIENTNCTSDVNLMRQLFDIAKRLNINIDDYMSKFDRSVLTKQLLK